MATTSSTGPESSLASEGGLLADPTDGASLLRLLTGVGSLRDTIAFPVIKPETT